MFIARVKTIFFDLDNTLFDHTRAEQATLEILLDSSPQDFNGINYDEFCRIYDKNNTALWHKMSQGKITPDELRIERFKMTLEELNIRYTKYSELSEKYLEIYSKQSFSLPGTNEILNFLNLKYELGILSNGFAKTQETKLSNLDLNSFFKYRIFSENVGAMKPSSEIFNAAMKVARVQPDEIVYVGDSYENDILGAKAVGWRAILFNPTKKTTHESRADAEIASLLELKHIF